MLGDRIRLADHFLDPGVFIRSMATRGSLGGLAEAALQAALLMDASGKDDVLLETVGVGQGEIDVVDHADTIVLALMPGSGDSIQALKAGVMEIPDVIVVNKCDHPLADTMIREVRGGARARARRAPGRCRWCAPRRRRARGSPSCCETDRRPPRAHRARPGTLAERRARNLRAEVLGIAAAGFAASSRSVRGAIRTGRAARPRRPPRDRPGERRARAARKAPTMTDDAKAELARPGLERSVAGPATSSTSSAAASVGRIVAGVCVDDAAASPSGCWSGWGASGTTRWSRPRARSPASAASGCPYSRDRIRAAPRIEPGEPLTAAHERALL